MGEKNQKMGGKKKRKWEQTEDRNKTLYPFDLENSLDFNLVRRLYTLDS